MIKYQDEPADRDDSGGEDRDEAAEHEAVADALEDLRDELRDRNVSDTRLAELYEEASTSRADLWNTATAFIDVEEGTAVVTDVSKLAQGSWAPEIVEGCDAMITVDVHPGMTAGTFESMAFEELTRRIEDARREAADARQEPEAGDRTGDQ